MATIKCTVQRSSWYEVYFEYSYTQNQETAVTNLSHALKLKQITNSYDFDTVASVTVSYVVAGQTFSKTARIDIDDKGNAGYTITLASGSSVISHNASTGVGSFSVSVNTSIESGGYGPGTIKLASQTVQLPTIYRASAPTVSASSVKMGDTLTITTNRKSSSFTHTLQYTFGGTTTTIATGVGASYAWKVPDLASKCNNTSSGVATITCVTYNGSSKVGTNTCTVTLALPNSSVPSFSASSIALGGKVRVNTNRGSSNFTHTLSVKFAGETIGSASGVTDYKEFDLPLALAKKIPSEPEGTVTVSCNTYNGTYLVGSASNTFKVTVPNNSTTQPVASFTLTPINPASSDFNGLFIQSVTPIKANFTASSAYSTIASYRMSVDGGSYAGNPATSKVLTRSGAVTVTGSVTDARGYSKTLSQSITVYPYKKPAIVRHKDASSIVCERSLQDGTYNDEGSYLHIKCKLDYEPIVVNGSQKNTCTLGLMYKMEGGSWSAERTLLVSSSIDNANIDETFPNIVSQTTKSYAIRLVIRDGIGSEDTYDFGIPTADVNLHLAEEGYGVAVGKYSERPSTFECAYPAYFDNDVNGRAYGLGGLPYIPENEDLDDYREFGCYAVTSNSRAETIENLPPNIPPLAGILRVYSATGAADNQSSGWVYVAQEYTPFSCRGCYRRLLHKDGPDAEWVADAWLAVGGVDSVIESGVITVSGVDWYYKKWYNGTAECWAKRNLTIDATTEWGSLYRGSVSTLTFPFTFKEAPVCHISVETTNNNFFVVSGGSASMISAPGVLLCRPTSVTGINVNVLYNVHGRWK